VSDTRAAAEAVLRRIGDLADDDIDLAEGALAFASLDRPQVPLDRYRDHLAELAADVAAEIRGANPQQRAAAVKAGLFDRHGYAGDTATYDDLQNANLMRVIDRRRGLPVTLGILMIHAARAQGWTMVGLGFPGHFLVRVEGGGDQGAGGRLILDPFHGGRALATTSLRELLKSVAGEGAELRPGHYEPVGNRDILLRLGNNVKLRLIQDHKLDAAAEAIERMLMIAPRSPQLWRDAGLVQARLGNLRRAIAALETYRELSPSDAARHRAASMIQELNRQLM